MSGTVTPMPVKRCFYCAATPPHPEFSCPRIHALEMDEDGGVVRIEFHDWRVEPEPNAAS
jgi:hypothetical protein